jgi:hypothetical protein
MRIGGIEAVTPEVRRWSWLIQPSKILPPVAERAEESRPTRVRVKVTISALTKLAQIGLRTLDTTDSALAAKLGKSRLAKLTQHQSHAMICPRL